MEALFVFALIGVPCSVFLIFCLTPKGKKWLRINNMI